MLRTITMIYINRMMCGSGFFQCCHDVVYVPRGIHATTNLFISLFCTVLLWDHITYYRKDSEATTPWVTSRSYLLLCEQGLHIKRLPHLPWCTWDLKLCLLDCEQSVLTTTLCCVCVCVWVSGNINSLLYRTNTGSIIMAYVLKCLDISLQFSVMREATSWLLWCSPSYNIAKP